MTTGVVGEEDRRMTAERRLKSERRQEVRLMNEIKKKKIKKDDWFRWLKNRRK